MASKYTIRGVADMSQHDEQLQKSAAEVYKYEKNVKSASGQLNQFSNAAKNVANGVSTLNDGFAIMNNSTAPLKIKLRELTNVLADLELEGKANTEEFTRLAQYAGTLSDAIGDASAAVSGYADDALSIKAATEAMGTLASVGSVATGVMGMLGVENDNLEKTLVKVQSAMAVANGIQQIANNLNADSALMLRLRAVWNDVVTASTARNSVATGVNTVATNANTVATRAWNVAKAISKALFGDLTGLILVGAAALATYTLATDGAKKKEEEEAKALRKTAEAHREKADKLNSSVGSVIAKYNALKASWQALSSEQEKRDWLEKNKSAFQQLGLSVSTLSDAENVFVKDTQRVVNALIKRAEATAMAKLYEDEYLKAYKKSQSVSGGGYQIVHSGGQHKAMAFETIQDEKWKAAGITRQDVSETREGISFIYKLNQSGIDKLNEYERKEAIKRKQETFADAEQIKEDYIKKAKEASDATAELPNYFKGESKTPSSSTPKTTTPKKDDYIDIDKFLNKKEKNGEIQIQPAVSLKYEAIDLKSDEFTKALEEQLQLTQKEIDERKLKINIDPEVATNFGEVANELGSAFSSIGKDFQLPEFDIMGTIAQSIANVALGYSQATTRAAKLGSWAWIAFAVTGLAQMVSMIATIKSATAGYANGGIVGGTTTIGDYNIARVNKGEMILNSREQSRLFNILNGNGGYGGNLDSSTVQFKINGNDLVGVLNNFNKKRSKVM